MSLFSDVDWTILLLAGGLLLLGGDNRELFRTAGRLYAKVLRMRDEFLRELRDATELGPGSPTRAPSAPMGSPPAPPAWSSPGLPVAPPPPSAVAISSPGVWSVGEVHRVEPLPPDDPLEDAP